MVAKSKSVVAGSGEHNEAKPTEVAIVRTFKQGVKKYTPRVEHNEKAWEKVQTCLMKGKGTATHAELAKALEVHFSKVDEDHVNFISYMTRRGSLVELTK